MADHEFLYYKNMDAAQTRRISYILFTKNRGPRLDDTIAHVAEFIRKDDEIIIADGASTDSTEEVVLRHRNIVHIFLSEPDRSSPHALNKAVLLARGKYIMNIPDDDRVHGDAAEKAVEVMEKNPDIDLLVCGGIKHFVTQKKIRPFYQYPGRNYGSSPEHAFTYGACGNGFVIRRSAFPKVGLFPLNTVAWDRIWFAQCVYYGGIVKFARINFFHHYITDDSLSRTKRPQIAAESARFMSLYCSPDFIRRERRRKSSLHRMADAGRVAGYKSMHALFGSEKGRIINGRVASFLKMKESRTSKKTANVLWDGGFS